MSRSHELPTYAEYKGILTCLIEFLVKYAFKGSSTLQSLRIREAFKKVPAFSLYPDRGKQYVLQNFTSASKKSAVDIVRTSSK